MKLSEICSELDYILLLYYEKELLILVYRIRVGEKKKSKGGEVRKTYIDKQRKQLLIDKQTRDISVNKVF